MTLPESYYTFAEHMNALEEEHEKAQWCPYERATGDAKWPVLCDRDDKYTTQNQCDKCKQERRDDNG
jgi:hypothetical protein